MTNLKDRVLDYSKKNPNGFTLNIETLEPVKFGFSVAFKETQNSFGADNLEKVINHALKNDKTIGGWFDEESGFFYFDSVKIFSETEFKEALKFAKENKQIAFYNLTYEEEIRLETEGL